MPGPRDALGEFLRESMHCPLCRLPLEGMLGRGTSRKPLRVVAYRPRSVRLECRDVVAVLDRSRDTWRRDRPAAGTNGAQVEAQTRQAAADDPGQYLAALARAKELAVRYTAEQRNVILDRSRRGVADATPRKAQIRLSQADELP